MDPDPIERSVDVVLVVLPFAGLKHPSLGVSLLKGHALRLGVTACVSYLNFQLAEWLGQELYDSIELGGISSGPVQRHSTEALLGEWFFADLVFDHSLPPAAEYISKFVSAHPERASLSERILQARARNREYVEWCVEEILRDRPRLVGLTTTFDQTCACLAVARRLKASADPPLIVMGGANCEGEMGVQIAHSFPYVDFVCTGEGDEVFPALLRHVFKGEGAGPIPGLVQAEEPPTNPSAVTDLDALPLPDFEDYFSRLRESPLRGDVHPEVLFETSRGCWWGAKQHCTFCGLNGNTMVYRSKSADRIIEELREVSGRYGVRRIQCVDNILDMNYFRTFFPKLIESGLNLELFYDTKANLKLEHVRMLREAKVRSILPGIESLSNVILRMMRKGSTAAQNIQLLRWCAEFEIHAIWSFLYGFPGEPLDEYQRMSEIVPLLTHLQPPSYCIPVQLDRFSPYFSHPEQFGVRNVRPITAYDHVFPLAENEVRKLAYFFDFDFQDNRDPLDYAGVLIEQVKRWAELASAAYPEERPQLDLYQSHGSLVIRDSRPCAVTSLHVLDGLAAAVYRFCDSVQTRKGLTRKLSLDATESDIQQTLDELIAAQLAVEIEGQYIALAVWRNRSADQNPVSEDSAAESSEGSLRLVQL
jgi:ribosomal peptide maturation radical SAM protein 1